MPKDLIKETQQELEMIPQRNTDYDIEGARGSKNSKLCSQLGETLASVTVTAFRWTAWWTGALATNAAICAIPGAILGTLGGYAHARWNEPCIEEKNSVALDKCALGSSDLGKGALYGALSTAFIGAAVTAVGFFKNPTTEGAEKTMTYSAIGVGFCCLAMLER
jgi:hypothetical protein